MTEATVWTNEAIISDALGRRGRPADRIAAGRVKLSRWRQFVGSYDLPALPDPTFVVHIAGKPKIRTWERDGWSEIDIDSGLRDDHPGGTGDGLAGRR